MGITITHINDLSGKTLYVDANPVIYLLNGEERFRQLWHGMATLLYQQDIEAFTGELCLAECLVKPLRTRDIAQLTTVQSLFENMFTLLPHPRSIFELSAKVRADSSLKMPDSIHVATALANNCQVFVTGDNRLADYVTNSTSMNVLNFNYFSQVH